MTTVPTRTQIVRLAAAITIAVGAILAGGFIYDNTLANLTAGQQQEDAARNMTFPGSPSNSSSIPVLATYPKANEVFARIRIPKFGKTWARQIAEGTNVQRVLDRLGVGHYSGTALPGQVGNFAVAAHRTTHGAAFNNLDILTSGDLIYVDTVDGTYEYTVRSSKVVRPSQTDVISPVPGKPGQRARQRWMTLTTCTPRFTAISRLVVHAELTQYTAVKHQ